MSLSLDENKNDNFIPSLERLGLSEKEAAVYIALLRLGEVGSSKIIENTGLHGQYVYQALGALEKKGMTQHVIKRGRKKFMAKSPSVLTRLVDEQKIVAEALAVKLHDIMVLPKEQRFEVFQGDESYLSHEFELLNNAAKNCSLLVIGGAGDRFYETMRERIRQYDRIRLSKNIKIRYIGSEGQRNDLPKTHAKREEFDIRLLPGLFTGSVNTNVWPDSLGFNIFGEPVTRFTISSPVVAGSYSQFFETLWKLAVPMVS